MSEQTTEREQTDRHAEADSHDNRRQVLYWRLLARLFDHEEQPSLESAGLAVVEAIGLPPALLDPQVSVDSVVQRHSELAAEFEGLMVPRPAAGPGSGGGERSGTGTGSQPPSGAGPVDRSGTGTGALTDRGAGSGSSPASAPETVPGPDASPAPGAARETGAAAGSGSGPEADTAEEGGTAGRDRAAEVRRAALVSKVLLNVFSSGSGTVTAGQLSRWQADAGWLERALGCRPGELRGGRAGGVATGRGSGSVHGATPDLGTLIPAIGPELAAIEADLVGRMRLREVLADPQLASQLTPSMSLIEQLLRDKNNLSGVALANAKALIRRFVDEVAEVLRTQVAKATVGALDRSVPPKRVFRNLDLDRTIWKNLTNWSPEEERLYVDRLYYRHTVRKTTPQRLVVVVDQSGSMVDSMVNCTILASIFAGLPKVDVHLIAYDTQALDLTPWVHDPFETLLRTNLGGGTDGTVAMALAQPKIAEPRNTVVVWISDFYEWRTEQLFESMAAVHRSGAKFIPVGSVTSSGRGSVNPWFRERFKDLGTPVISGHIRKLVHELKTFLT
ncbi:vWA domain-containing protein [Streptomyces wuyuanensis]|uniref:VWA domain containing CoxE-like protein n=1 Tax=Streptomyces wuyuanensis TaxID=1196353 RepID=A0A1G9Q4C6_9ACTN|nr:VWA domain-containing protein [Streptomyces wuyuanensis]SDM05892.1 VWA domain containing CoxE-like protein [Streptomyces wuyuanensis]